jgi:outer membrane protein assembly factor BamB
MLRTLLLVLVTSATLLASDRAHARTAAGDLLWQDEFDPGAGQDLARAMASDNGRVVVVGSAHTASGDSDFVVRTYDATSGALLWADQVDVAGGDDEASAVVMDGQRVVVLGHGVNGRGDSVLLLRAYDPKSGALEWEARAPATRVTGLAMEDNRIVVTGRVVAASGSAIPFIRAYVARSGALVWEDDLPPVPAVFDFAKRAVALHGGRAFVAETVHDGDFSRCVVRAYNVAKGTLLWQAFSVTGTCRMYAMATEGRFVLVAGQTGAMEDDFHVRAFDARTGEERWRQQTSVFSARENAAVAVDAERHAVFVAGWRFAASGADHDVYLVHSYDLRTGDLNWEDKFDADPSCLPNGRCRARDLVVDRGRVFTAGDDGPGRVWFVRTYDAASGDILWTDRVEVGVGAPTDGQSVIAVQAVAIDDGRVFVAGSALEVSGDAHFLVRAYDAR